MPDKLTDLEIDKIIAFNNDPILVEAVRKVLLESVYTNGTLRKDKQAQPLRNAAFGLVSLTNTGGVVDNVALGEDLRALYQGVMMLEVGLDKLSKIKKEEVLVDSPYNNAI